MTRSLFSMLALVACSGPNAIEVPADVTCRFSHPIRLTDEPGLDQSAQPGAPRAFESKAVVRPDKRGRRRRGLLRTLKQVIRTDEGCIAQHRLVPQVQCRTGVHEEVKRYSTSRRKVFLWSQDSDRLKEEWCGSSWQVLAERLGTTTADRANPSYSKVLCRCPLISPTLPPPATSPI